MQALIYIALLSLPILLAGIGMFYIKLSENRLKVILAFSAAYLLALSFLHLIPEVFASQPARQAGLWIIAGFFIQVLLEFFSSGIEHGHAHIHSHDHKIPPVLLFGLYLHSFIEGFPLGGIFSAGEVLQNKSLLSFLAGITLHNIPISIAFTGLLLQQHVPKNKTALYLVMFSSMAPLGALAGHLLEKALPGLTQLSSVFTALVIGIFLHIATTIIFESSEKNHRYHISKLFSILLGLALAWLMSA
ncbi:MAG: ZIP family metal transporter [Bacteroidia bacterium]